MSNRDYLEGGAAVLHRSGLWLGSWWGSHAAQLLFLQWRKRLKPISPAPLRPLRGMRSLDVHQSGSVVHRSPKPHKVSRAPASTVCSGWEEFEAVGRGGDWRPWIWTRVSDGWYGVRPCACVCVLVFVCILLLPVCKWLMQVWRRCSDHEVYNIYARPHISSCMLLTWFNVHNTENNTQLGPVLKICNLKNPAEQRP